MPSVSDLSVTDVKWPGELEKYLGVYSGHAAPSPASTRLLPVMVRGCSGLGFFGLESWLISGS